MKRGGRREAKVEEIEEDEKQNLSKSAAGVSDADDDDGDEDLSLKIVEKSLMRKAMLVRNKTNGVVLVDPGLGSASDSGVEKSMVTQEADTCPGGSKKKRRKKKKSQNADQSITIASEEKRAETTEEVQPVEEVPGVEAVEADDENDGDASVNVVLQKLLRGPRYFDPPASGGWPSCYNCGEEGHMLANCPSFTKKKKPCFICGSLDHGARQCPKDQDCFICKQAGHRARDCPEKYKVVSKICLRCGHSGHHMFSCSSEYSHDDIKEIRCYICKSLGHLCCANYADDSSIKVSCYKCGELGHTGLSCSWLLEESTSNASPSVCYKCREGGHFARECSNSTRFHDDGTVTASLSSCYKCGEGGHFARECRSYAKARKRNHESSTPALRSHTEIKDNNDEGGHLAWEYRSSAKARKRNLESQTPALRAHTEIKDNNDEGGNLAREYKSSKTKARKRNHESSTPALIAHTEIKDNNIGVKSAPHDLGKKKKRGKTISEHKSTSTPPKAKRLRVKGSIVYSNDLQRPGTGTPSKSRHRGGWITEDPGDFYTPNAKQNSWRSPSKPSYDRASGAHMSNPQSFKQMKGSSQSGTPDFHGSAPASQQGFHASRLSSSSPASQQQGLPASRFRSSQAFQQDYPYHHSHNGSYHHTEHDSYRRHPPSKLASFQNRFSTSRLDSAQGYEHGYSESRFEQFDDSGRVGNQGYHGRRHGTSEQYGWR